MRLITLNIANPSVERAGKLLEWLATRPEGRAVCQAR